MREVEARGTKRIEGCRVYRTAQSLKTEWWAAFEVLLDRRRAGVSLVGE